MTINQKGFTLVELLVVIVIIGVLATGAVAMFSNNTQTAKENIVLSDVKILFTQQITCGSIEADPSTCNSIAGLQSAGYLAPAPLNPWTGNSDGYIISSNYTLPGAAAIMENNGETGANLLAVIGSCGAGSSDPADDDAIPGDGSGHDADGAPNDGNFALCL